MLTADHPAGDIWQHSAPSDLQLCGWCGEGSRAAFEELVARYRVPLLAYCGRLVGSDHAEGVLQRVLLKAWLALEEHGGQMTNLRAWLYRIAHNQAADHLRKGAQA
jgi:DNA-directed RNA polymerase specialized sigma24 family protein